MVLRKRSAGPPTTAVACLALFGYLLAPFSAHAVGPDQAGARRDEALTLAQAVTEGRSNNPELAALGAAIEGARGRTLQAKQWQNPELFATPGLAHAHDGESSDDFYAEFGLSQLVEFPGKRALRVAAAEKDLALRKLAVEAFSYQLAIEIRRTFFSLLLAERLRGLRDEQVESVRRFAESARRRVEAGYSSDFDMLKAQAELIAAERSWAEASGRVEVARLRLKALLGRSRGESLSVVGDVEDVREVEEIPDPVARALRENLAYRAEVIALEKAGVEFEASRLDRYPDFTVGPSMEYAPDEQIYKFGVSIPIPVLNRNEGEIAVALAERRRAEAELVKLRREIVAAVEQAVAARHAGLKALSLYTPNFLGNIKRLAARAERGYAENSVPLLVYIEARRSYFETVADYYDTLGRVAEAQAELDAAIGSGPKPGEPTAETD